MTSTAASLSRPSAFRKPGLKEATVLLVLAWFIPFAIHLLPWTGVRPLGAYLLPMFWAAFVAVYFYGAALGLAVGLFSPVLNLLVTGLPAWKFVSVLSFELVVYVLVATWAVRKSGRLLLTAPLAYLAAKMASTGLQAGTGGFGDIGAPWQFFSTSIVSSLPGLVVLAGINAALVWWYPRAAGK